jgi:hypothetical protein
VTASPLPVRRRHEVDGPPSIDRPRLRELPLEWFATTLLAELVRP